MGISKSRTHDIMENELRCVQTASCGGCDRECGECSLLMDDKEIIKAYGYVIRMLELPSVTQSGKWIEDAKTYYEELNKRGLGVDEYTPYFTDDIACSECLAKYNTCDNETQFFKYCPNCGARMVEPQGSEE